MRAVALSTHNSLALRWTLTLVLIGVLVGLPACTDTPADVGYYTESHVTDYDVELNGDVRVSETIKYVYQQGFFHYGYAFIPLGYTDGIRNVEVWEGNRRYRQAGGLLEQEYTYRVEEDTFNDRLAIRWFYPYTRSGEARTFTLKYTLRHAVRIYPGGDQLWVVAVGGEHASVVYFAKAIIHLPMDVTAADLRMAPYGVAAQQEMPDSRTIRFSAGQLEPGQKLEIRVQWPHGFIAETRSAWQVQEERVQAAVEGGTVLSLVFLVFGFGVLFLLWYLRGRDPQVRTVAAYLPEPPSDPLTGRRGEPAEPSGPGLPPALAGLLLAEKSSVRLIVATIVDLSRQGVLSITEWGERDYEFKLLWGEERTATLRPYERGVLEALFSPLEAMEIGAALVRGSLQTRVSLRDVRKYFGSYVRPILGQIAQAAVQEGLFVDHPEATAGRYFGVGLGLILGTIAAMALLFIQSPNALTTLAGGLLFWLDVLMVWGYWGFLIFLAVAFGAVMTGLAILGQFVGRYTWYAVQSPWTYVAFVTAGIGFAVWGWVFGSLLAVLSPMVAVIIWSLGLIVFSFYMPRTTPQGALERARWEAFKRYLSQIELFGDLAAAQEIFDRYLSYAIAFNIEKGWVRKFVPFDTPAPAWFIVPALGVGAAMDARRIGALRPGAGMGPPEGVMAAASLSDVSDGLYHSLQDVSDGLFAMLGTVSSGLSTGPLKTLDLGAGGIGGDRGVGGWSGGIGGGPAGGGGRGVG